jgi:lysozyme family protein
MAKVTLSDSLRKEYQQLFDTCQINSGKLGKTEQAIDSLITNQPRYEAVGGPLGIPWYVVAVIHNMEASQKFTGHLHNGDPLSARTVHVPKGQPQSGSPPFTWEVSATDALTSHGLAMWNDWTIPGTLYCIEGYNGWGYRAYHPAVKSPYLWGGSNHYTSGKYVADGTWSDTAVTAQIGAATLLRRMAERHDIAIQSHIPDADLASAFATQSALFTYSPKVVTPGGASLQHYLNQFPGVLLSEDGRLGDQTSLARKQIFGQYLRGDPRELKRKVA